MPAGASTGHWWRLRHTAVSVLFKIQRTCCGSSAGICSSAMLAPGASSPRPTAAPRNSGKGRMGAASSCRQKGCDCCQTVSSDARSHLLALCISFTHMLQLNVLTLRATARTGTRSTRSARVGLLRKQPCVLKKNHHKSCVGEPKASSVAAGVACVHEGPHCSTVSLKLK